MEYAVWLDFVFIPLHARLRLRVPPVHVCFVFLEHALLQRLFDEHAVRYPGLHVQFAHPALSLVDENVWFANISLLVQVFERADLCSLFLSLRPL